MGKASSQKNIAKNWGPAPVEMTRAPVPFLPLLRIERPGDDKADQSNAITHIDVFRQ